MFPAIEMRSISDTRSADTMCIILLVFSFHNNSSSAKIGDNVIGKYVFDVEIVRKAYLIKFVSKSMPPSEVLLE